MNQASKYFLAVAAGLAILSAGCSKKPVRPDPSATVMGPTGNGQSTTAINPAEGSANPDLQTRPEGINFGADNTARGLVESVYFDFDRSNIKPSERAKVQAAKDFLDKNPTVTFLLEGHCDWHGTAEYNLALGDRRANEVKKYLSSLGVSPDKLNTVSKGSEDASKNADDATRAKDRRVEFVVVKSGAAAAGPAGGSAPAAPVGP
jgi:peptidoglycan-associated lipoprotein